MNKGNAYDPKGLIFESYQIEGITGTIWYERT